MFLMIGVITIFFTGLTGLFIAVCDFFLFPRDVWRIRLGKNFGILSVFLAVEIIVFSRLEPGTGVWVFFVPVALLFAGLSGFLKNLKNTLFSVFATVIATIFLINFFSLLSLPPGPPPESPPIQPVDPSVLPIPDSSTLRPSFLSEAVLSFLSLPIRILFELPPALMWSISYLFAITGIISSIIQNRRASVT